MMLTDEQQLVRDSVRGFIDDEIAPELPEADREPLTKDVAIEYMQTMAERQKLVVGYELTDMQAYT